MNRFDPMATGVLPVRRWLPMLAMLVTASLATLALTALLSSPADAAPPPGRGGGGNSSLEDRLTALEAQVAAQAVQITALQDENGLQADELVRLENEKATTTGLDSAVALLATTTELAAAEGRIAELERLLAGVTRAEDSLGRDTLRFSGMNLQIVNGRESTSIVNGLGNLIVGYDAPRLFDNLLDDPGSVKSGSHNLIVGDQHHYSSYGGLVAGQANTISGAWATVTGGALNIASGGVSTVSGGRENVASGGSASVSGGGGNVASGPSASVSGGLDNIASRQNASVSGGMDNIAEGRFSSVSGGEGNAANGMWSSVSGGVGNAAGGDYASILGGQDGNLDTVHGTYPAGL